MLFSYHIPGNYSLVTFFFFFCCCFYFLFNFCCQYYGVPSTNKFTHLVSTTASDTNRVGQIDRQIDVELDRHPEQASKWFKACTYMHTYIYLLGYGVDVILKSRLNTFIRYFVCCHTIYAILFNKLHAISSFAFHVACCYTANESNRTEM